MRDRDHIRGLPGLNAKDKTVVHDANLIITRTVAIIAAGADVGSQFLVENPSDRGVLADADLFLHSGHGPVWLMPEMQALRRSTAAGVSSGGPLPPWRYAARAAGAHGVGETRSARSPAVTARPEGGVGPVQSKT